MSARQSFISSIEDYIATQPDKVQVILRRIRSTIRKAAPTAIESISYRMPAFTLNGVLVYFAAFKHHIGVYPPVRGGDKKLMKLMAEYQGPKGNLKFRFDQPVPYALIARITKLRLRQNLAKMPSERKATPKRRKP